MINLQIVIGTLFIITSCEMQDPVYEEVDGVLGVEAEHFSVQKTTEARQWFLIDGQTTIPELQDGDPPNYTSASGSAYLEVLPDTRRTHDDTLKHGINFSNKAGEIAILDYKVYFNNPGKYYVWARIFSTGSEDNGIHVGLDGTWPESGQRMQWCEGKSQWTWDSKQRTKEVHCGVPELIWLDVETVGMHTISFSMREDGVEFDKWVMSKTYLRPEGSGPAEVLYKIVSIIFFNT